MKVLPERHKIKLILQLTLWLSLVFICYSYIARYSMSPGPSGHPAVRWPLGNIFPLADNRPTLIMVIHPMCPCSKASIAELRKIASALKDKLKVVLIVVGLPGLKHSILLEEMASSYHFLLKYDQNGSISKRLGVLTSGHTLLYDPQGALLYSGGITSFRGHEGDNNGKDAIIALTLSSLKSTPLSTAPVFGCELFGNLPKVTSYENR